MTTFLLGSDGGDDYADWTTMQLTESEADGDTVSFRKGETFREQITVPASGSSTSSVITYTAHGEGADPIINGADLVATWTEDTTEIFSHALDSDGNAAPDNNRIVLDAADLSASGTEIRVQFAASSSEILGIKGASIGIQDGVSSSFSSPPPTRLTFDTGSSTKEISANATAWSDWITFTLNASIPHLVHLYVDTNEAKDGCKYKSDSGTHWHREDTGTDDTLDTDMSGGEATSTSFPAVSSIEIKSATVWQAALTTEPSQVFFDGTKGTLQASAVACTSEFDWYWDANVLYVYSTGDPDGDYSSPGIEASIRTRSIHMDNKEYITIENLELRYSEGSMLGIIGANDNFIIDNCHIQYAGGSGINVWATVAQITNGSIKNCNIHNNNNNGIFMGQDENAATGVTIEDNVIYDNGVTAQQDHGIYLNYACSNIIRYNLIYGSAGIGLQLQNASDSNEIYYNIIYGSNNEGMWLGTGDGGNDNKIYNNILYNQGGFALHIGVSSSGNLIKNNIIHQASAGGGFASCVRFDDATAAQSQTLDYNCYYYPGADDAGDVVDIAGTKYTLAEWKAYTGSPDPNSINSDPKMIDVANNDFRLLMGSPCVGAGTDVSLTTDYRGRSIRHAPDIGAYEDPTNALF